MKSTSNKNEYDEIINFRSLKFLITTTKNVSCFVMVKEEIIIFLIIYLFK